MRNRIDDTMPGQGKLKTETAAPLPASSRRTPQQGRSKASLERMMAAARELILERSNEDFTLHDVGARGKVSIGSIYLRFQSKDDLVRDVLVQALEELAQAEAELFGRLRDSCGSLNEYLSRYVEGYAQVLKIHAPLLRMAMRRAEHDPQMAVWGKKAAEDAVGRSTRELLRYRSEFGGGEHETRARYAYHVVFATLARELSLGSSSESVSNYDWDELKRQLSLMCLAYLKAG